MAEYPERWAPGGLQNQGVGAILTAAATLAPTHKVHALSGTTETSTITPPWTAFSGEVILIPGAAWTTTTSGNIAKAITAVTNAPVVLVYNPVTALWYPMVP